MKESAREPNKCYSTGDVDIFADNTQRVRKTSRVRENGTTPLNIVTNVVYIQSNPPLNIQALPQYNPDKWLNTKTSSSSMLTEFENELNERVFCPYRAKYFQGIISKVVTSKKKGNND